MHVIHKQRQNQNHASKSHQEQNKYIEQSKPHQKLGTHETINFIEIMNIDALHFNYTLSKVSEATSCT
jgi:hypothetical protein